MRVRVLGAHNLESRETRHACLLIDGVLALDAGSLASALTQEEQTAVRVVLLSHGPVDHMRDLPTLGLARLDDEGDIRVFGLPATLKSARSHLMDGDVYPDMTVGLNGNPPKYRFDPVAVGSSFQTLSYTVTPIQADHPVPAVGYVVRDDGGTSVAYTGDTGGELMPFFENDLRPSALFVDVTFPNALEERAKLTGHLTPDLLRDRIVGLRDSGIGLPRITPMHVSMVHRDQVKQELDAVSQALGVDLRPASEDAEIELI